MGTFEKLGILVIVVIIVMILAVAIYQWGGNEADSPLAVGTGVPDLTVRTIDDYGSRDTEGGEDPDIDARDKARGDAGTWPGGVPRSHTLRKKDNLWILVFSKWRLKDSFIKEIVRANPGLNPKRLRPGRKVVIPNPAGFFRDKSPREARVYEVQIGDTLESVARTHLGRKSRWREIIDLNPGLDPKRLRPGQKILLPALR